MSKQDLLAAVAPDNDKIMKYIKMFSRCDGKQGIEKILEPWAKSKGRLYRLFGNKLTREVEVSLEKTKNTMCDSLSNVYSFDFETGQVYAEADRQKNAFVREYLAFFQAVEFGIDSNTRFNVMYNLLNAFNIIEDTCNFTVKKITLYNAEGKKLALVHNMKPMRALGKIVNFYGKENFPNWESFRLAHSNVFTTKEIKGTLVFSIHPLDYMSMSDNDNGWETCMSWSGDGCYRAGTLEMLYSNNVVVSYLKSANDWEFADGYTWNNKSWRNLLIVTKDIIVAGKSYPYTLDALSQRTVTEMQALVKESFGWEYKYGVQRYMDMLCYYDNFTVDEAKFRDDGKKSILFKSKLMYNDMLRDNGFPFFCVRNKPDKTKVISFAGVGHCLDCGGEIHSYYADGTDRLICKTCQTENACSECGDYLHEGSHFLVKGKKYCARCLARLKICPDCGKIRKSGRGYIILHTQEDIDRIPSVVRPHDYTYWEDLQDKLSGTSVETCNSCYEDKLNKGELVTFSNWGLAYLTTPHSKDSEQVRMRLSRNWKMVTENPSTFTTVFGDRVAQLTAAMRAGGRAARNATISFTTMVRAIGNED